MGWRYYIFTWARGVCFLLKNKLECKIFKQTQDTEGRMVCMDIQTKQGCFTVIDSPNIDSPEFFVKCIDVLNEREFSDCIIAGDYNIVLDVFKDKKTPKIIMKNPSAF